MSNLSWFTTDHDLDPDAVDTAIRRHVTSRFGDRARITRLGPEFWDVSVPQVGSTSAILVSSRRVTFKPCGMVWSGFIEWFVLDHLAAEFGGTCGGEFDDDARWQPEPGKYPTLESYLRRRASAAHRDLDEGERAYIDSLPEELR